MYAYRTLRDGRSISYLRYEEERTETGYCEVNTAFCLDVRDSSRLVRSDDYTAHCSYCYLNIPHTKDLHDESVSKSTFDVEKEVLVAITN